MLISFSNTLTDTPRGTLDEMSGSAMAQSSWLTKLTVTVGLQEKLGEEGFSSVHSLSCVWIFATPWTAARQASLSITNFRSLLELMSIESVMPSNLLILCHPLLLLLLIFHSIRVSSKESVFLIRWPMYWSFSFCISPSNIYSALISFRIDWFDLLAVQGTLQHHLQK